MTSALAILAALTIYIPLSPACVAFPLRLHHARAVGVACAVSDERLEGAAVLRGRRVWVFQAEMDGPGCLRMDIGGEGWVRRCVE